MTALICDAPQRSECKGCKGHGGYYACERCVIKGTWIPGWGVRFLELNKRPRLDEFWDHYKYREAGEPVRAQFISFYLLIFGTSIIAHEFAPNSNEKNTSFSLRIIFFV